MLLHHRNIQDFLHVCSCIHPDFFLTLVQGDEEELTRLLAESRAAERIEVDENGGKLRSRSCMVNTHVFSLGSWGAGQHHNSRTLKAYLVGFRHYCKYPYALTVLF